MRAGKRCGLVTQAKALTRFRFLWLIRGGGQALTPMVLHP